MKKILLNILFLLIANNSFAKNGFYFGGTASYVNHDIDVTDEAEIIGNPYYREIKKDDNNFLFGLNIGYKYYYNQKLSISPEISINLLNTTFNNKKVLDKKIQDLYSLNFKFGYNVNEKLSIFVLGGVSQFKNIKTNINVVNGALKQDDKIAINVGFGTEYYLSNNFTLNASFIAKKYKDDFSHYTNSMNYEKSDADHTISTLNIGLNYYF